MGKASAPRAPNQRATPPLKLGPRFDERLLSLRDKTDDEGDRSNGKNGDMLAVVGVEMREVN